MTAGHAFLAPSAAAIWAPPGGCRAYPLVAAAYPNADDTESRDGTACHEAAAMSINAHLRGETATPTAGWVASNGVVLDDDMVEAVEMYVDDVVAVARSTGIFGGPHIGIERRMPPSPRIHPENSGTPDAWIYQKLARKLTIWDAKFGYGLVEARRNWQCINYAALILDELGVDGLEDQTTTVEIRVVQPFAPHPEGPIRTWSVKAADLRPYINQLEAAAHECLDLSPLARSGSHCRYCPGRARCTTAQRAAMSAVDESGRLELHPLGPDALAFELRLLRRASDAIAHRLAGLEQEATSVAKAGAKVPGFALTPAYGRDRWTLTSSDVYTLGKRYGVDLRMDKPVTPNQAVKMGIDRGVIKEYIEKPQTGVRLVDEAQTLASRVFKPRGE